MADPHHSPKPVMSIAAVERETGLSKDTLRVWERRYGFPKPERDAIGDRRYSFDQVERLRLIKRLVDGGHRAGQVVTMPPEALARLEAGKAAAPAPPLRLEQVEHLLPLLRRCEVTDLRNELRQALLQLGLGRFVTELVAPMTTRVGDAWARDELEVYGEHLYTQAVTAVLNEALHALTPAEPTGRPRVLLATVAGEEHGLGLQMVQALLHLEGAACLLLGTGLSIHQLQLAAQAHHSDVVCLSFTACMNGNLVLAALADLRSRLPRRVDVWAGGSAPILHRRDVEGVRVFDALAPLAAEVRRWREKAGAAHND